jgi:hypothetical protein
VFQSFGREGFSGWGLGVGVSLLNMFHVSAQCSKVQDSKFTYIKGICIWILGFGTWNLDFGILRIQTKNTNPSLLL